MTEPARINPLKHDASTISTVKHGDRLIYWHPGDRNSTHYVTVVGGAYTSAEGDLVIDVVHCDGHESTELTSSIGLTGERYSGKWTAIAILNEEVD